MMKGLSITRGIFYYTVWYNGERRHRSTHTAIEGTAEDILIAILARRNKLQTGKVTLPPGVDPWDYIINEVTEAPAAHPVVAPVNIDDFQTDYIATLGPPLISDVYAETQKIYLGHFARFREKNPDLPKAVKDWRTEHIEKYRLWRLSLKGRNSRGQKVRALTVKKEVASISVMFDSARRQGLIEQNPVRDLKRIPDDAPDATFRTIEEITALEKAGHLSEEECLKLRRKMLLSIEEAEELKAMLWGCAFQHYMKRPGDLALFMHIDIDAALRVGEIHRLTTPDIYLNVEKGEGVITARSRKQNRQVVEKERHAPIYDDLVRRLADWVKGLVGRRLFHECKANTFRAFVCRKLDAATKGTKFWGIRPHSLRHSLRTNMYEEGVDEKRVDAMLGHTTPAMGDRYRHQRVKRLAAGTKAMAEARARAAAAVAATCDKSENATTTTPA